MLNFEIMTVEQMKKYCTASQLSKLENQDLANILLVANGLLEYLSDKKDFEDQIEKNYWNCVHKLLDKEFKKRNIQTCYTDTVEAFVFINETLKTKDPVSRKSALQVLSRYKLQELVYIRKQLDEEYSANSLDDVKSLMDEVITSRQNIN